MAVAATCWQTRRSRSRPGRHTCWVLEPDVDVEEAAAAAGRGVAALQGEPGVGGGEQGDVLDGVLDVEVFEGGDVEVGGVEVGLDEAGQDGAAAGVEADGVGGRGRHAGGGAGVGDAAVAEDEGGVEHGRLAGAVEELAVADDGNAGRELHGTSPR